MIFPLENTKIFLFQENSLILSFQRQVVNNVLVKFKKIFLDTQIIFSKCMHDIDLILISNEKYNSYSLTKILKRKLGCSRGFYHKEGKSSRLQKGIENV